MYLPHVIIYIVVIGVHYILGVLRTLLLCVSFICFSSGDHFLDPFIVIFLFIFIFFQTDRQTDRQKKDPADPL